MSKRQPPLANGSKGPGTGEKLAIGACISWLVLGGGLWWGLPGTVGLAGWVVPLLLLATTYLQARQLRLVRQEAAQLRGTLDGMQDRRTPQWSDRSPAATGEFAAVYGADLRENDAAATPALPDTSSATAAPAPLFRSAQTVAQPALQSAVKSASERPSDPELAPDLASASSDRLPTFTSRRDLTPPPAPRATAPWPRT